MKLNLQFHPKKMKVNSLHDYTFATSTPPPLAIIEYHPTQ